MGFCNCYKKFIPFYSKKMHKFFKLLTGNPKKLLWNEDYDDLFLSFEKTFTETVPLWSLDFRSQFVLFTDASDYTLGEVLLQGGPVKKSLRLVDFHIRTFTSCELNYTMTEKNC
jgi:RNase H-like domain found in reverse transcriptase